MEEAEKLLHTFSFYTYPSMDADKLTFPFAFWILEIMT